MQSIVMFTNHYFESKRKAGFHWLAEALARSGSEVTFVTTSISWLSYLRKDPRCAYPILKESGRIRGVAPNIASYVYFRSLHPVNLRSNAPNKLTTALFQKYGATIPTSLRSAIENADAFIFESDASLMLFATVRRINPAGRYIYRVSDDLALLQPHPVVLAAEQEAKDHFDLISVPTESMLVRFKGREAAKVHPHGLQTDMFDTLNPNPYTTPKPNVVFIGNSHFDYQFLELASGAMPNINFHIIGGIVPPRSSANIFTYGELPFKAIIPYVQWADAGLQTRAYSDGAESLNESLKVKQYTYCRLPIIAPTFLKNDRENMFYYKPGDTATIKKALLDSLQYERSAVPTADLFTWDQVAATIKKDAEMLFESRI